MTDYISIHYKKMQIISKFGLKQKKKKGRTRREVSLPKAQHQIFILLRHKETAIDWWHFSEKHLPQVVIVGTTKQKKMNLIVNITSVAQLTKSAFLWGVFKHAGLQG